MSEHSKVGFRSVLRRRSPLLAVLALAACELVVDFDPEQAGETLPPTPITPVDGATPVVVDGSGLDDAEVVRPPSDGGSDAGPVSPDGGAAEDASIEPDVDAATGENDGGLDLDAAAADGAAAMDGGAPSEASVPSDAALQDDASALPALTVDASAP